MANLYVCGSVLPSFQFSPFFWDWSRQSFLFCVQFFSSHAVLWQAIHYKRESLQFCTTILYNLPLGKPVRGLHPRLTGVIKGPIRLDLALAVSPYNPHRYHRSAIRHLPLVIRTYFCHWASVRPQWQEDPVWSWLVVNLAPAIS